MSVENASHHKHLRIYHDKKLNFKMDIETVLCKVNKSISIIKKGIRFQVRTITTIYNAFFRSHIDYGNVIYDQPTDESSCEKLGSAQYKAALAITDTIQDLSRIPE